MLAGIDRFATDGKQQQALEAYDVFNDDGELRRRDAFRSMMPAPGFLFPAARCVVRTGTTADTGDTTQAARIFSNADGPYFFFGCTEVFDSIYLPVDESEVTPPTETKRLVAHYWNGTAWTAVPFLLDTTMGFAGSDYREPMTVPGTIAFHRAQLTGWATRNIASLGSLYWIRLTIVDADGAALVGEADQPVLAPGARVALAAPVNGLFPVVLGGRHVTLVGNDRQQRRGLEGGGGLFSWRAGRRTPSPIHFTRYESSGVFGAITYPQWQRNETDVGAAGTEGTANAITDHPSLDQTLATPAADHSFLRDNPTDAILAATIQAQAGATTTTFTTTNVTGRSDDDFEGCVLICTNAGATGIALGEWRVVAAFTGGASSSTFTTEAWSANPYNAVTPATFRLLRPPRRAQLRIPTAQTEWQRQQAVMAAPQATLPSPTATRVYLASAQTDEYNWAVTGLASAATIHFNIVEEMRWAVRAGLRWSAVQDSVTRRLVLTNGESGLLAYDGEICKELEADTSSDLALFLAGKMLDDKEIAAGGDPTLLARSKFRTKPPSGRYVTSYLNTLVVACSTTAPYTVWHSLPGDANAIWPLSFETQIRDPFGEPITGITPLYDRLFCYTARSIHEGRLIDTGELVFNPISQGTGFASQASTVTIVKGGQAFLAGLNSKGVSTTNGSEPESVLPTWDRIIPSGINVAALGRAVGASWPARGCAVWAVASRGSSTNDLVVVWDYEANAWWVWRHPFGVSALAVQIVGGREVLMLGTDDGFVQFLWDAPTDDGEDISGTALSPPEQPAGPVMLAPTRLNLTMKALGDGQTVDVSIYADEREIPLAGTAVSYPVSVGTDAFGASDFGTAQFADEAYKSFSINMPRGARANIVQYRITGTKRWRLRRASFEGRPLSSRGKR